MYTLFTILIVIASVLLILLVLVQNSKGGGLASGFSSGNQVMGAPKTTDFLEKSSWTLAAVIVFLSILAVGAHSGQKKVVESESYNYETSATQNNSPVPDAENTATDAQ